MVSDLLKISDVEGEPRILDTDLAKRLAFSQPINIRKTIRRHRRTLEQLGTVATVATVKRGQDTEEFYLNRKQAIFITAKSETPEATDITIEIIHRFDEYEQGGRIARPEPALRAKPHDEWSEEELRTKIAEVNLYRRTMSTGAAVWLMRREGFPMPPDQLLPAWQRQDAGLLGQQTLTVNILNGRLP